jgi:hypothetical protein
VKSAVDVGDPVFDEVKESKSSLDKPSFPFVLTQNFRKRNAVVLDSVISPNVFVEVVLPVKHFLESVCLVFVSAPLVS